MPQDFFNWDDDPDQRRITDSESFRKFFGFPYMDERGMHPWHPSSYERYSRPPMYAPPPEVGPTYDDFNENAEMSSIQRPRSGIQPVAAREQFYPGNDIFAGQPDEPRQRYGAGERAPMPRVPRSRPQQMPGPPSATPPPGMMPMRPQMPGINPFPRYSTQPSAPPQVQRPMPMAPPQTPFRDFDRGLTPSSIPQPGPGAGNGVPPKELMEMLKLLSGSFGGGTGGGGF